MTLWAPPPLSRAKLVTRFDDRHAVAKFSKSRVRSKVPEGSTLIFEDAWISLQHSVHVHTNEAPVQKPSAIRQTGRQTDTGPQLEPALALRRAGKKQFSETPAFVSSGLNLAGILGKCVRGFWAVWFGARRLRVGCREGVPLHAGESV